MRKSIGKGLVLPSKQNNNQISGDFFGKNFSFSVSSEVFSSHKIDEGTKLLIENIRYEKCQRFLDLGCGYGAVGVVAASLLPEAKIYLTDKNPEAAKLAAQNCQKNNLKNTVVYTGDLLDSVAHLKFDIVALNLPWHEPIEIQLKLIYGVYNILHKGGRFYIVMHKNFPPARKEMMAYFGEEKILVEDETYVVLYGEKKEEKDFILNHEEIIKTIHDYRLTVKPEKDQFFMASPNILEKIVQALEPWRKETILEIGSGPGFLTRELSRYFYRVYAVETDKQFSQRLNTMSRNIETIFGDGLKILDKKLIRFDKIVSNLPFSLCEPIFLRLPRVRFKTAVFTIPEKFYHKVKNHPQLSVELVAYVPRLAFYPLPQTEAVIVRVRKKNLEIGIKEKQK